MARYRRWRRGCRTPTNHCLSGRLPPLPQHCALATATTWFNHRLHRTRGIPCRCTNTCGCHSYFCHHGLPAPPRDALRYERAHSCIRRYRTNCLNDNGTMRQPARLSRVCGRLPNMLRISYTTTAASPLVRCAGYGDNDRRHAVDGKRTVYDLRTRRDSRWQLSPSTLPRAATTTAYRSTAHLHATPTPTAATT